MPALKFNHVILLTSDATGIELITERSAPQFSALLRTGIYCSHAYAHGNPTQFSFPTIMTSSLPLDFGGYDWGISNRPATLAEVMRRAGYATYGFSTTVWLSSLFGYARGFDHFFALHNPVAGWNGSLALYIHYWNQLLESGRIPREEYLAQLKLLFTRWFPYVRAHCDRDTKAAGEIPVFDYSRFGWKRHMQGVPERFRLEHDAFKKSPQDYIEQNLVRLRSGKLRAFLDLPRSTGDSKYVDAGRTFDAILDILRLESARPKFVWAHFRDVHDFKHLPHAVDPSSGTPTRHLAMAYWDGQLRRFLATLRAERLDETSLVVVFSDHGSGSACSLRDHSLRIPLVFWSPLLPPQSINALCGLWDVAPTVLDLMGLPPEPFFQGTSVRQLSDKQDRLLIAEHAGRGPCDLARKKINLAVTNGRHKLLFNETENEEGFTADADSTENSHTRVPKAFRTRFAEVFQNRCRQLRGTQTAS